MSSSFDDFLGLRTRNFKQTRLVIFSGKSGSGKSTAIDFLLREHPDFKNKDSAWLRLRESHTGDALEKEVIAIDELITNRDLTVLVKLLIAKKTVLAASHLNQTWLRPLKIFWSCQMFVTDLDESKIERYLKKQNKTYSPEAISYYCKKYRANYTDIDIIVERYPEKNFDKSLEYFERFCQTNFS